jgi:hypothetical protein
LKHFVSQWETITSDKVILQNVQGIKLDFIEKPFQTSVPFPYPRTQKESEIIDQEIGRIHELGVIEEVQHTTGEFISNIFIKTQKLGKHRLILNLVELNEYVEYHHFKMDNLENAIKLMKPNAFQASVDIKDAYYSIPIHEDDRKYLRFQWRDKLFQYNVLPNGLSSGPRIFTKLCKPIYATLRKLGYTNLGYIDDTYLQGDSFTECQANAQATVQLLNRLGFLVNDKKSVLTPTHEITFLGFILNTTEMSVKLTGEKVQKRILDCKKLLRRKTVTIRQVAQVIGFLVSSIPGVQYGKLHYRSLEIEKDKALKQSKGNFDATMTLTVENKDEIQWWVDNLAMAKAPVMDTPPQTVFTCDASKQGWGLEFEGKTCGGRWTEAESLDDINVLETKAIYFGLKALFSALKNSHIRVMSDNTTAVAYVNKMGGCKSQKCNSIAKLIWQWCAQRNLWLSAAHTPGKTNTADTASRKFDDRLEWMLNPEIFKQITDIFPPPKIDLFASRLNAQIDRYVAWKPDPHAVAIDAFSISWRDTYFYAFPPFSVIPMCLKKMREEESMGLFIAPLWDTQPWFTQLLQIVTDAPRLLPRGQQTLIQPHSSQIHPLASKLRLIICKLSGKASDSAEFQSRLPRSLWNPGELARRSSTKRTLLSGLDFVVKNRVLSILPI